MKCDPATTTCWINPHSTARLASAQQGCNEVPINTETTYLTRRNEIYVVGRGYEYLLAIVRVQVLIPPLQAAMPCPLYETLGPVWLGKLRAGRRLRSRIHGYQRTFLPLEQVSCSKDIFTLFVELYLSLDALVRFARVELSDKFRIIDAVTISCCLLKHLPY